MKMLGGIAAIGAFVGWVQLVRPLHVVETFIGLAISAATYFFVSRCEFRYKLDSDSSRSWTPIPAQPGQPKVIT